MDYFKRLYYFIKLRKDLEDIAFKVNPYNPCVANRIVQGKQLTITWRVDDIKSSHDDPRVNNNFHKWLESKYGSK